MKIETTFEKDKIELFKAINKKIEEDHIILQTRLAFAKNRGKLPGHAALILKELVDSVMPVFGSIDDKYKINTTSTSCTFTLNGSQVFYLTIHNEKEENFYVRAGKSSSCRDRQAIFAQSGLVGSNDLNEFSNAVIKSFRENFFDNYVMESSAVSVSTGHYDEVKNELKKRL